MTLSSPPVVPHRSRWRGLTRGALVATAVLALAVVAAPVASASVPSLASGRQVDLHLNPSGGVPAHLDLSHARFQLTSGRTTAICETDESGDCSVQYASRDGSLSGTTVEVHAATYTLTQVAGAPGLAPKSGVLGTIEICDCWDRTFFFFKTPHEDDATIANTSQYRGTVNGKVVDKVSGRALSARYRLTGPGYPVTNGPAITTLDAGTDSTDRFGSLSFSSPLFNPRTFRPGAWTLTPVTVPAGYAAAPVTVTLQAGDPGGSTWTFPTIELVKGTTGGGGTTPTTTPATTTATASTTSASPTTETTSASPTTAETTSASPTTVTTSASPTTATTSAASTTGSGSGDPNGGTNVGAADITTPADPSTPTTATSTTTGSTSAAPPVGTSAAAPPARVATSRVGTPGQVQQQVPAPAASSSAPGALPSGPSVSPTSGAGTGELLDTSVAEHPDLTTVSSTIGESGLIGIGIAFVALVVGLFFLVRWRTRRG